MDNVDKLSNLTGFPKKELQKIFDEVKENREKLEQCPGPHDFSIKEASNIPGKRWKCSLCLGTIDVVDKFWYEKGLKHGLEKNKRTPD